MPKGPTSTATEAVHAINNPAVIGDRFHLTPAEHTALWPVICAARCTLRDRVERHESRPKQVDRAVRTVANAARRYINTPGIAHEAKKERASALIQKIKSGALPEAMRKELLERARPIHAAHRAVVLYEQWQAGPLITAYLNVDQFSGVPARRAGERLRQSVVDYVFGVRPADLRRELQDAIEFVVNATKILGTSRRLGFCQYPGCINLFVGRTKDIYCDACKRAHPRTSRQQHRRGRYYRHGQEVSIRKTRSGLRFQPARIKTASEFWALSDVERFQWLVSGGDYFSLEGVTHTGYHCTARRRGEPHEPA